MRGVSLLHVVIVGLAISTTRAWKPPRLLRPFAIAGGAAAATAGAAALGAAGVAVYLQQQQKSKPVHTPEPNTLTGQTILITGGTTGLGLESAKRLAVGGPANIIITARSDAKGQQAVKQVQDYLQSSKKGQRPDDNNDNDATKTRISYRILDLDDLQSVRESVQSWKGDNDILSSSQIDVLMNNAGIMALPERQLTIDGIERQVQSNHLGHFLLTASLAQSNMLSNDARIINISSEAHKFASSSGLDFAYMWKAQPSEKYGAWKSYGQSKLANILFTQELQRRVDDNNSNSTTGLNWTAVTLHPGTVGTDLGRHLFGEDNYQRLKEGNGGVLQTTLANTFNIFLKTPEQGATSQIWLAARAETDSVDVRGQYIIDCEVRELSDFAKSKDQAARLWKESEELTGVTFNI